MDPELAVSTDPPAPFLVRFANVLRKLRQSKTPPVMWNRTKRESKGRSIPLNLKRPFRYGALFAALVIVLSACGQPAGSDRVDGALIVVGSNGAQASIDAWKAGWTKANKSVSVDFSPDGQAVGFTALASGLAYVATAEAVPGTPGGVDSARCTAGPVITVPTTVNPIALAYNLAGIKGLRLDAGTLSAIYLGEITQWDDPRITSLNPTLELPSVKITPVKDNTSSSATYQATNYLKKYANATWTTPPSNIWPGNVVGITGNNAGDVAKKVDDNLGSLAFMYRRDSINRFSTAELKFDSGFVPLSEASITQALDSAGTTSTDSSVGMNLDQAAGDGYPLAAVGYQSVCRSYENQETAQLASSWLRYVLSPSGQDASNFAAGTSSPGAKTLKSARDLLQSIQVPGK